MEKIAILGGSFDPVHLGHLYLLHSAMHQTDYSRFIVIPAKVSNFKRNAKPVSSDEDRLKMMQLAVEDFYDIYPDDKKQIEVSEIELTRGGVSYTYDTVMQIKKTNNIDGRIGFIIGDDHIAALTKWYRFDDLKNEVEFIICPRNHSEDFSNIPSDIKYQLLNIAETKVENATDIRSDFEQFSHYLSRRVLSYARERKLYC